MTTPSDPAPDPWNACALAPSAVTQRYRMERRHNGNGTVEVLASHVGALPALTAAFDAFIHLDTRDGAGVYRSTDPAWQLVIVPEPWSPGNRSADAMPVVDDAVLAALAAAGGRAMVGPAR